MNARDPVSAARHGISIMHVLHPGDVVCGSRGEGFETLLGSCVAIELTDPRRTVGAMCHLVHAGAAPLARTRDCAWGQEALQAMFRLLGERGIDARQCEAFVHGGGNMFPDTFGESHVGAVNAHWALDAMSDHGIRVIETDLGGAYYRKLVWTVGIEPPRVVCVPV